MTITIFAGKGGVGKSTSAVAYALSQADSYKTLVVDNDGGHSLTKVLNLDNKYTSNMLHETIIRNLSIAVIDQASFETIEDAKAQGNNVQQYLSQFQGDYGLTPFCDMVTTFFGVPTDVVFISKFSSLIDVHHQAQKQNISQIILDVEPTAGLERLLNSTTAITRSIQNLQKTHWAILRALSHWPDITAYLKGEYIQHADVYATRLEETAKALRTARYLLVTTPEGSPVDQMEEVERIVTSYGGNVIGYVVNNLRGEPHETAQVLRVHEIAGDKPVIEVQHDPRLCDPNSLLRRRALREVGKLFEVVS